VKLEHILALQSEQERLKHQALDLLEVKPVEQVVPQKPKKAKVKSGRPAAPDLSHVLASQADAIARAREILQAMPGEHELPKEVAPETHGSPVAALEH
jgi:hypothetical protein